MKIGLIDVDGKMPNLALMKLSAFHKACGDEVTWYDPLFGGFDKVYASKVFDFSADYGYWPDYCEIERGGTGYDLRSKIAPEAEGCSPDYSIYPKCEYSLQLFSRGCIRACEFCVVPEKEGRIRGVDAMDLNPKGKHIEVLDNNFFGHKGWESAVGWLQKAGQPVSLHGVDARILTRSHADALNSLKHIKQIHIAWDDHNADLRPKLREIATWIKPYKLMCYVLIGFGSTEEQDLWRVESLREIGIDPYVMAMDKDEYYQHRFQRWVNHKAIWKTVKWKDYRK